MPRLIAHKTVILALLAAFCAALGTSSNSAAARAHFSTNYLPIPHTDRESVPHQSQNQFQPSAASLLATPDPVFTPRVPDKASDKAAADKAKADKAKKDSQSKKSGDQPSATPPPAASDTRDTSTWSLVLGTYTGDDHATSARNMISTFPMVAPQVQGARIVTNAKGSMVVYGRYTGRDDPKAKADTEEIKAITYKGRKVFDRVMLTYIDTRLTEGRLHPHDLLSARKAHPKVDPLYTLDVAIWLANEDPKIEAKDRLTYVDATKKATAYCEKLRTAGFEAYFYLDEKTQRTTVTVGLFDRRSIDKTSGLYSSEVVALQKKFPIRLTNGEPVYESKDHPVGPKLVLVPEG